VSKDIVDILYSSKDILSSMIDSIKNNTNSNYDNEIKQIKEKIFQIVESPAEEESNPKNTNSNKNDISKNVKREIKVDETIRVSVKKINELINMSTETNIAFLRLINLIRNKLNIDEQYLLEELYKMIINIQEESIKIRMRELDVILSKFKRIVRDMAKSKSKEVNLKIEGGEIEVDKTVLEKIEDPLKHMIRNSIDHGIETPEEREKLGKPKEGTILIKTYHYNGQVRIEISDDGGGLDKNKILKKAIEKGMIDKDTKLPEKQIYDLIFEPGFSTADKVSDISGRGVGMDVVKRNIGSIYGNINIKTKKNIGTTFVIDIPLTLSIVDGVYVKINGNVFALSNREVIEFIHLSNLKIMKSKSAHDSIKYLNKIIFLFDMTEFLNLDKNGNCKFVAIVKGNENIFGIYIDEPLESNQIVIKSVEKNYKKIDGILGSTIYKDGTLAPILDIRSIERKLII
jgi:two-component system chemotaxis sensor kinase CheA